MKRAALALVVVVVLAGQARAGNAPIGGGGSCSGATITDPVASTQGQQQAFDDGLYTCQGGTSWVPEAFIVGGVDQSNSAPSCNSTNAGMIQWTGGVFQGCDGSSWVTFQTSATPAFVLISTQTASSSATLQWTGLGSSYYIYELLCNGLQPSATGNGNYLQLQFGEGATPTWEAASYNWADYVSNANTNGGPYGSKSDSSIGLDGNNAGFEVMQSAGSQPEDVSAYIYNIPSSSLYKSVISFTQAFTSSTYGVEQHRVSGEYQGDTNAATAVRVRYSQGNISVGKCSLYGVNQ